MVEIKVLRNVILSNIDLHDLPGFMVLLLEIAKIFQIRKFEKSDTDISDLIMERFSRDKCCQK